MAASCHGSVSGTTGSHRQQQVSCSSHSNLSSAKRSCFRLDDPYIGFKELDARWVNEKAWIYRTVFEKPKVSAGSAIFLVFDGLDTFAKVKLDDQVILESDNMFLGHRIDVTQALAADGEHTLEVEFDCALLKARELQSQDPGHKWVGFNGDPARMAVRKAQYHWGWDWGPVLMTAGIWRAVRLEVFSARVANLWPQVRLAADTQTAEVTAVAEVESFVDGDHTIRFSLSLQGNEIASQDIPVSGKKTQVTFRVNQPNLWWPHGYGEQTLYEVSASLLCSGEKVDQESKKFGIRNAEIVQQPDKHGKSFFFRINGKDIFCGGSCWIPADSLLPAVTAERYRKWIQLMVAGRQVMIRYVALLFLLHASALSNFIKCLGWWYL